MLKHFTAVILFFCLYQITISQVNTELMRKGSEPAGFSNSISLDLGYKSGNSNYANLKAGVRSDYHSEAVYSFLSASLEYKEGSEKLITHKGFAHLRAVYKLTPYIRPEVFVQKEFNKFISLNDRNLAGIGARLPLITPGPADSTGPDFEIYGGLGLMYEYELFKTDEKTELIRSTNYVNLSWNIDSRVSILFITYYQFDIQHISDYRLLNDTKLSFSLNDYLAFSFNINYRYDNEPLPGIENYDIGITNGIVINF